MPLVEPEEPLPTRKKLRLSGFDYRSPGIYFVTICTSERRCCFGDIAIEEVAPSEGVALSELGQLVRDAWLRVALTEFAVTLDEFVIMPNHMHALLELTSPKVSLSAVVGAFKSVSTRDAREAGLLARAKLWQRGYHDHVVRDEASLGRIREYIENNPLKWHLDRENPVNFGRESGRGRAPPLRI